VPRTSGSPAEVTDGGRGAEGHTFRGRAGDAMHPPPSSRGRGATGGEGKRCRWVEERGGARVLASATTSAGAGGGGLAKGGRKHLMRDGDASPYNGGRRAGGGNQKRGFTTQTVQLKDFLHPV
jgi:hypothetical protein